MTAQYIVIEEAAQTHPDVIKETIVPLLQMKGAALTAITTPLGTDDMMHSWTELKDNGALVFLTIHIVVKCPICVILKQDTRDCKHNVAIGTQWHSQIGRKRARLLLGDELHLAMREIEGDFANATFPAFDKESVNFIFEEKNRFKDIAEQRSSFTKNMKVDKVVCAIDPAAGGLKSTYAIVWMRYSGPIAVVSMI